MRQPDRRKSHRVLYLGYGLIVAVIVLLALAVNGQIDRRRLHVQAVDLYQHVNTLNTKHAVTELLLADQVSENKKQDQQLKDQQAVALKQDKAMRSLRYLRNRDAHALTALHNELAVRHATDPQVKSKLQQLETSNAAARSVIQNAPPANPSAGQP